MTQWATFAGLTGVVLVLLLGLSILTQRAFDDDHSSDADATSPTGPAARGRRDARVDRPIAADDDNGRASRADEDGSHVSRTNGDDRPDISDDPPAASDDPPADGGRDGEQRGSRRPDDEFPGEPSAETASSEASVPASELESRSNSENEGPRRKSDGNDRKRTIDGQELSTGMLLANVALSQGLFAAVLLGAAVYAAIPAGALGVEFSRAYLLTGLAVGSALGVALYVANELGAATAKRVGIDHDEELRAMLAPDTVGGWLVLLLVVLPVIAFFEEFLFRAAMIGALSVGFDVSPWLLAVVSSVAFAVGHGMQGPAGIVVTGALGFVLAAAFILTGSLLVVVVAHYLVNAFEFVVHEGLGPEWAKATERSPIEALIFK